MHFRTAKPGNGFAVWKMRETEFALALDITTPGPDALGGRDDSITGFQLDALPVRGRIVRLGPVIDEILSAHDYPASVAALVGEAVLIALLIGDSMKFEGRLIIQASGGNTNPGGIEGKGAVSFVVADYTPSEGVRGFAKFDAGRVAELEKAHGSRPGAKALLGEGHFAMTIDQGADMAPYQGVVSLDGPSLAACAEHYFWQSEQLATRIKLAIGEHFVGDETRVWRAGGAMIQRLAGDDVRTSEDTEFDHVRALFDTTEDAELLDPGVTAGRLLYRLFHEDGVRLQSDRAVTKRCTCEAERLKRILASFPAEDRDYMTKDGRIVMTCEYCNKDWKFAPEEVETAGR